jgi:hypothetical protein
MNRFHFPLYAHAASVPAADWEAVAGIDSVFLDRTYLQILEKSEHTRLELSVCDRLFKRQALRDHLLSGG